MTDLKEVDPAVISTRVARPKASKPQFPLSAFEVVKVEENFSPKVNWADQLVVECPDEKYVCLPRASAAKLPTLGEQLAALPADAEAIAKFEYPANVLAAINHWVEKHGKDGKPLVFQMPCTHTDFNVLITDDWQKNFFNEVLNREDSTETLIGTMNASEKFGMEGLCEFCLVGFSCLVRGKSEAHVLHALQQSTEVADTEIDQMKAMYPWFNEASAPQ